MGSECHTDTHINKVYLLLSELNRVSKLYFITACDSSNLSFIYSYKIEIQIRLNNSERYNNPTGCHCTFIIHVYVYMCMNISQYSTLIQRGAATGLSDMCVCVLQSSQYSTSIPQGATERLFYMCMYVLQ